jgi:hypothetical protein
MERDSDGCPTERVWLGGQEVIVHYDDIPAKDITTVHGIRCTTALRTVIDLAADVDDDHLEQMVRDALHRRLFTREQAMARVGEDDISGRPGAVRLRQLLLSDRL